MLPLATFAHARTHDSRKLLLTSWRTRMGRCITAVYLYAGRMWHATRRSALIMRAIKTVIIKTYVDCSQLGCCFFVVVLIIVLRLHLYCRRGNLSTVTILGGCCGCSVTKCHYVRRCRRRNWQPTNKPVIHPVYARMRLRTTPVLTQDDNIFIMAWIATFKQIGSKI